MKMRVLAIGLALVLAAATIPCCLVWKDVPVSMVEEKAVVVWDEASQTQHFIRSASFEGGAMVGFVFPAPTLPTLGLADNGVFKVMQDRHKVSREEMQTWAKSAGSAHAPLSPVVSTQQIGSYQATILKSTDSAALNKWMKDNGFSDRPEAKEWTEHYAKRGWYLVAYRFNGKDRGVKSEALRISFKTSQPHYPYHMPSDIKFYSERNLLLYTISSSPLKWVKEDKRPSTLLESGRPLWLSKEDRSKLAKMLDLPELSEGMMSTESQPYETGDLTQNLVAVKNPSPSKPMTEEEGRRILREFGLKAAAGQTVILIPWLIGALAVIGFVVWVLRRLMS